MEITSKAPVLALAAGDVVTLDDARGIRLQARAGTVWVTEEANPRDHIVGPGEALILSRSGRTVIQALQPAWIALGDGAAANDALDPVPA
ncbi:MAG TPA: DUF2917 domain-containing protein [Usitatibacter sp.]|jgi:hypothetical protein|nr:DUF2917 domain-containing protein [Usitatibacter sp.]